jgi:hypothetical protein
MDSPSHLSGCVSNPSEGDSTWHSPMNHAIVHNAKQACFEIELQGVCEELSPRQQSVPLLPPPASGSLSPPTPSRIQHQWQSKPIV